MRKLCGSTKRILFVCALTTCAAFTAGCSGDDSSGSDGPMEPTADVSEELSGGNGVFIAAGTVPDLAAVGYVEHEYVAAGLATSYAPTQALTGDGRWSFVEDTSLPLADYRTRILVRRPADETDFSGTVIVEWLNVSGGADANPDYVSLEEEIFRQGHVWVGVSAQIIGVEGGPVLVVAPGAEGIAGIGIKGIDPARYGSLAHPGDGYSFDIYTQIARALRAGGDVLGGATPRWVIAAGESQSAIALTTYYNGVQPLTAAFDGFLVHSRGSIALPLVGPGEYADLAGSLGGVDTILRTDLDSPVLELQTEGDVTGILNSVVVRQADSDTFRLWEVAGTAHADTHLVGIAAEFIDCGVPINDGPMHIVAKAALRALDDWVRDGQLPRQAPLLELTSDDPPQVARDSDGIALGGIRTPPVDVPAVVLSGVAGPTPSIICLLLGSTTPLSAERLAELYTSRAEYEQLYAAAADAVIAAAFVLAEDRDALIGYSRPEVIEN